ncbi:hypothetical protein BKA66DRAFT_441021 [Pyrenochaeta sp. MPI-SDFR-AT-0127]|nr:hypothetical protein BKA66DRAFT_441021 [Pyrenochaeta sp. MPI-SDFR-AT-0127]
MQPHPGPAAAAASLTSTPPASPRPFLRRNNRYALPFFALSRTGSQATTALLPAASCCFLLLPAATTAQLATRDGSTPGPTTGADRLGAGPASAAQLGSSTEAPTTHMGAK